MPYQCAKIGYTSPLVCDSRLYKNQCSRVVNPQLNNKLNFPATYLVNIHTFNYYFLKSHLGILHSLLLLVLSSTKEDWGLCKTLKMFFYYSLSIHQAPAYCSTAGLTALFILNCSFYLHLSWTKIPNQYKLAMPKFWRSHSNPFHERWSEGEVWRRNDSQFANSWFVFNCSFLAICSHGIGKKIVLLNLFREIKWRNWKTKHRDVGKMQKEILCKVKIFNETNMTYAY